MRPEARKHLWDAREAGAAAREFARDRTLDDYLGNEMLRAAIERKLEIVGEALNRLSRSDAEVAERIPELARIVAFRNLLAHGYGVVDDRLVWDIVESKLPALLGAIRDLLAED